MEFDLTDGILKIEGQLVNNQSFVNNTLTWNDGPELLSTGELTLLIDPISLLPMLYGKAGDTSNYSNINLTGMKPAIAADLSRKILPVLTFPIGLGKNF